MATPSKTQTEVMYELAEALRCLVVSSIAARPKDREALNTPAQQDLTIALHEAERASESALEWVTAELEKEDTP